MLFSQATTADIPPFPCAEKLAFLTRAQAEAEIAVQAYHYSARLKAYQCRHCKLWHMSSH